MCYLVLVKSSNKQIIFDFVRSKFVEIELKWSSPILSSSYLPRINIRHEDVSSNSLPSPVV